MSDLDICWCEPYKVKVGGIDHWRRNWLIPDEARSAFFEFWREEKFKLAAQGFRVYKEENDWFLSETKLAKLQFMPIGITRSVDVPQLSDFLLPVYDIRDDTGLRPWQAVASGRLVSALNTWGAAIDGSDTGCHAKGQQILMADGHIKNVEDVIVGDFIMGWNGPQMVTELKRGKQRMVRIVPIKGEPFIVNLDHVLTVVLTKGCSPSHKRTGGYFYDRIVDVRVRDYLNLSKTTQRAMKLFSVPYTEGWTKKNLPYSPYFVGVLLGDGGMSSRSTVTVTSTDTEIWENITAECKKFGWKLGSTNENITKRITNASDLFSWLRKNDLFPVACENKYIPHDYKTSGMLERLELLAGLLDTDGYYSKSGKCYEITLKSKQLIEDIAFLARSLGLAAYIKPCKKKCSNGKIGQYYRTHISGDVFIIPCNIQRKIASPRKQKKNVLRRGFKIELLDEDAYFGFSLNGDGRFLLGDFTVTHNTGKTYSACAVARDLGMKMVVVCPKAVISSWKEVIRDHFKMEKSLIAITNYEQLKLGKTSSDIASYVIPRGTRRKTFTWKVPKNTLIVWDESQKLKNWKTKNAKTCIQATKQGYKQLFCSATNATNPMELRTVGNALKLYKGGQTGWFQFLREHGCSKGFFGMEFTTDDKIRKKVLKKLHKDIFLDRGVRLRRDSIPNFPECDLFAVLLDMDNQNTAQINSIYDDMTRELKELDKLCKGSKMNHLVVELRHRQRIELVKVPLFIDMIEEAKEEGFSIVVFVNFTDTITAISQRLGIKCIFDGQVGDTIREENKKRFQDNDEQVILVNVMSGGGGLSLHDLHGGHPRLSLISPSYSPVNMRQAIGRIWRDDAKTKAIQKLVCVAHTVEENVYHNVMKKLNNLDLLNDGDLSYAKNYEVIHT